MNSNLKVGSNNAGLFIGNVEILGGVQKIATTDIYEDSLPVEVFIVNLTNAEVVVGFCKNNSITDKAYLRPFEIRTFSSFTVTLINNFTLHFNVSGTYEIYTSLKLAKATTDSNQEVNVPEIEFVDNIMDVIVGTDYQSAKWEYVTQSTKVQDTFAGGWIVLKE